MEFGEPVYLMQLGSRPSRLRGLQVIGDLRLRLLRSCTDEEDFGENVGRSLDLYQVNTITFADIDHHSARNHDGTKPKAACGVVDGSFSLHNRSRYCRTSILRNRGLRANPPTQPYMDHPESSEFISRMTSGAKVRCFFLEIAESEGPMDIFRRHPLRNERAFA